MLWYINFIRFCICMEVSKMLAHTCNILQRWIPTEHDMFMCWWFHHHTAVPCYAATLLRLASRSELPQLEQRAKEALEMKAMDGSAVHCFTHGHPKIVSKQRRGWLICKFCIHDYDMHDTLPERLNFSHSKSKSLTGEFESYGTLIPNFGAYITNRC